VSTSMSWNAAFTRRALLVWDVVQPKVTVIRSAVRVRSRDDTVSTRTTAKTAASPTVTSTSGPDVTQVGQWTSSTRARRVLVRLGIFSVFGFNTALSAFA